MAGWNARDGLSTISDSLIDASLYIEELRQKGVRSPDLDAALYLVTDELCAWGLDDIKDFHKHLNPRLICLDLLRRRDGADAWPKGTSVADVYKPIFSEYKNLLKILSHGGGDLLRAKSFCLLLSQVALQDVWNNIRRGLAT